MIFIKKFALALTTTAAALIMAGCGITVGRTSNNTPINSTRSSNWLEGSSAAATKPISVTIDANAGDLKVCDAVRQYLLRISDPKLFKSFTIVKVTKGKSPSGQPLWSLYMNVRQQPGTASGYGEGMNTRYVDLTQTSSGYEVTGLATGP